LKSPARQSSAETGRAYGASDVRARRRRRLPCAPVSEPTDENRCLQDHGGTHFILFRSPTRRGLSFPGSGVALKVAALIGCTLAALSVASAARSAAARDDTAWLQAKLDAGGATRRDGRRTRSDVKTTGYWR